MSFAVHGFRIKYHYAAKCYVGEHLSEDIKKLTDMIAPNLIDSKWDLLDL